MSELVERDEKERNKDFNLFDVISVVLKYWRKIALWMLIASIVFVVFILLAPQYWLSTAVIMPVEDTQTSTISLSSASGLLGSLGSSLLGSKAASAADYYESILKSREFNERVIRHFNLIQYYKIDDPDTVKAMDMALKNLYKHLLKTNIDDPTSQITISIETKNKYLSRDIANYYCSELDEYNHKRSMTKGKLNRIFLEKRVQELDADIDSLTNYLKEFQTKYKVVDVENQISATVQTYSTVVEEQIKKDLELQYSKKFLDTNSPSVDKIRTEKDVIDSKLREMETGGKGISEYQIALSKLPAISRDYIRLKMNLEIKQKIYEFVYPQYEASKIQELKDTPTIQIIDKAREAGLRYKPKRGRFCVIAFIITFILIVTGLSIYEYLLTKKDLFKYYKRLLNTK